MFSGQAIKKPQLENWGLKIINGIIEDPLSLSI